MPFAGNNFVRNQNFVSDRNAGPPSNTISAEKVDNELDNLAAGLTTVKTAHETQKSLFPSPVAANAGQFMRTNAAGTAFELRTLEQMRADIAISPGIAVFREAGTTSWIVPAGVKRVWVQVYGAGGGTSSFNQGTSTAKVWAGGGGAYVAAYVDVTPSSSITIKVGAAGTAGTSGPGTHGGESAFGTALTAAGGKSAQSEATGAPGGIASMLTTFYQSGGTGQPSAIGEVEAKGGMAGGPLGGRAIGWFEDYSPWPGAGGSGRQINTTNKFYTGAGGGAVIVNW